MSTHEAWTPVGEGVIVIAPLAGLCPLSALIVCATLVLVTLIGVLNTLVKNPQSLELILNRIFDRRKPRPPHPPENGSE